MIYLIFLFAIFYSILAWRRSDWATMLIILALPSYLIRFEILGVPFTILEAMILIAFLVWFIKETNFLNFIKGKYKIKDYLENRKSRNRYPFGLELSLLVLIAWIAAVVAGFSNEALGIWKAYFFEPALFFILVLNVSRYNANDTNDMRMTLINNEKSPNPLYPSSAEASAGKQGGDIEKILWALAGSAFLVSVFAIYQKLTGSFIDNPLWQAGATRRVVSFFGYPNAVGLYLGPIVLVMIGWLMSSITNSQETIIKQNPNIQNQISNKIPNPNNKKFVVCHLKLKNIFIFLTILLSLLSIYFAKSEGALIGIVAALFVFGILAGGKIKCAAGIAVIVCAAGIFSYLPAREYAIKKITLNDFSGQVRKLQWAETWKLLKDGRIFFGSGLANYQNSVKPYHQEGFFFNKDNDPDFRRKIVIFDEKYKSRYWQPLEIYMYPHNILLNFWTELGLMGALLFIWIIGKYFWISISNVKYQIKSQAPSPKLNFLNIGLIGAMVVIIIHGLVDVPYFKNDLAVMFWLLIAMMSLLNFEIKKQ